MKNKRKAKQKRSNECVYGQKVCFWGEREPIGEIDWEPLVEVAALLIPPNFQSQEEISEIPLSRKHQYC